jgi:hypothetical protein
VILVRTFLSSLLLSLVAIFAVGAVGASTASAHSGKQSYLYISLYDDEMDGRIEMPVRDLGEILGVDFGTDAAAIEAAVVANRDEIVAYAGEHLEIGDGTAPWTVEFGEYTILDLGPSSYVTLAFVVDEDFDETPRAFVVEFDAIVESNPEHSSLLHIENDVRSGVVNNESDFLVGFSTGQTVQEVVLDEVSTVSQLAAVRGSGTDAVRTGIVHLLFIGAMMVPVGLLAAGTGFRDPAPTVSAVLRRSVVVLLSFAAGHVVTLWLTGLGVIDLPDRAVVALSAVSLLAVAIWVPVTALRPTVTRVETTVIAVLGLVQGFGLGDIFVREGFDRSRTLLSLLGFTLGIEAAAVLIAALVLPTLLLLRRTPLAPVVLWLAAAVAGGYALAWILEGIADADWSIDRYARPWRVWPRNLFLVLLTTAIAAGLRWLFGVLGTLRDVSGSAEAEDEPAESAERAVTA